MHRNSSHSAYRIHKRGIAPVKERVTGANPGSGQILIRIAACGLNFADLLMIDGSYQDTPPHPFTPGMELSGRVEATGPGTRIAVGTRVAVFAGQGGLAEFGIFDEARCVPIPDAMPFDLAAGFLVAYGTAHLALTRRARLQRSENLVVLGAGGGVGLAAVEIGAALRATVIAVARGPNKQAAARKAGARHVIDGDCDDLRAEILALGGADVIFDPVGGEVAAAALRAGRPELRLVVIGFASGEVAQFAANRLLVKNADVLGVYWGGYMNFAPDALRDGLAETFRWYAEGRIAPGIGHIVPFDRALDGLDLLRKRQAVGKVVVTMDP